MSHKNVCSATLMVVVRGFTKNVSSQPVLTSDKTSFNLPEPGRKRIPKNTQCKAILKVHTGEITFLSSIQFQSAWLESVVLWVR